MPPIEVARTFRALTEQLRAADRATAERAVHALLGAKNWRTGWVAICAELFP